MTIDEAIEIISDIDKAYRTFTAEEIQAFETLLNVVCKYKALGEELRKVRKGIADKKVLIGYNMAIAICNKHLGESEADE